MKRYVAKTDISVNVILSNGKSVHVSFTAVTGGSSVFYTEDKELQEALERHYKYGKLFKEDNGYGGEQKPSSGGTKTAEAETEGREEELKMVPISDYDAAKAYLAEHFGISRTKLKLTENIEKAAREHGIVFQLI